MSPERGAEMTTTELDHYVRILEEAADNWSYATGGRQADWAVVSA